MPELPPRVTMPLLTLITQQSLDEDYQIAAERRAFEPPDASAPRGQGPRRLAIVVIVGFGLLVSTAFVQNSLSEDAETAGRSALIERINAQSDRVGDLQTDIADLRETNADLVEQSTALSEEAQAAEVRLQRLEVRTGFIAVRGQGVRVVVDNAPNADANQILRDSDLALLANGLWTAGAEAIAINGQRLTTLSAIRNSGVPIEVNNVGIAPPYTVLAIGDTRTVQSNFADSSSGLAFFTLRDELGFGFEMENSDNLSLPAAPQRFLRLRSAASGTSANQSPKAEEAGP